MPDYSYQISSDNQIIHETYSGVITWDFLKESVLKLTNDPLFKHEYDTIVDLTDTFLNFNIEELKQFNQVHNTVFQPNKGRTAFITNTPNHVVMTMIFGQIANRQCQVFSTYEAALNWLLNQRLMKS